MTNPHNLTRRAFVGQVERETYEDILGSWISQEDADLYAQWIDTDDEADLSPRWRMVRTVVWWTILAGCVAFWFAAGWIAVSAIAGAFQIQTLAPTAHEVAQPGFSLERVMAEASQ